MKAKDFIKLLQTVNEETEILISERDYYGEPTIKTYGGNLYFIETGEISDYKEED